MDIHHYKKASKFIKIAELPPKQRQAGIIEIRRPYYTAVTHLYWKFIGDVGRLYWSFRLNFTGYIVFQNTSFHLFSVFSIGLHTGIAIHKWRLWTYNWCNWRTLWRYYKYPYVYQWIFQEEPYALSKSDRKIKEI